MSIKKLRLSNPLILLFTYTLTLLLFSLLIVALGLRDSLLYLFLIPCVISAFFYRRRVYLTMLALLVGVSIWVTSLTSSNFGASLTSIVVGGLSGVIITQIIHSLNVSRKRTEEALRESEERFRTVANFTYDWEYWIDPAGNYIYVSPSCERITGYRADEFIQNPALLKSIVHPDDLSKVIDHNHAAMETGEIPPIDFRIITRSNEERWIGHVCQPVHGDDGRYLGQRSSNRDITARKLAEEALRESEARQRSLLNAISSAGILLFVVDNNYRVRYMNGPMLEVFGDAVGKVCYLNVGGLESPCPYCQLSQVIKQGQTVHYQPTAAYGRTFDIIAVPYIDTDGTHCKLEVIQDITKRKQTEESLRESEERLRLVIENMPVLMDAFDKQGRIIVWNQECERVTGYGADEIIGNLRAIQLLYPEEDCRTFIIEQLAKYGGNFRNLEWDISCKDGSKKTILWSNMSEQFPVPGWHSWAIGFDITERKQAEKERERLLAAEREQRLLAETLREVTLAITSQSDHQAVLEEILHQSRRLVPHNTANIALLEDDDILRVACQRGYEAFGAEKFMSNLSQSLSDFRLEKEAVESKKPVFIEDTRQEPRWIWYKETDWIRANFIMPICHYDRVFGLLRLDGDTPGQFSVEDAERLQPLVNAAAIALENTRLYEQTQQDAETNAILLKEVNHRVKNNLAAIIGMLYIEQRHAKESREQCNYADMMNDLLSRIMGLSTVHQLLSHSNWSPLPLSELAQQVIDSALHALPSGRQVLVDISSAAPVVVTPKEAHHLAIIINELTTNVVKYAAPAREITQITLRIALEPDGETILFEFKDNGPGFPAAALRSGGRNVGMYLIENTARHSLRGEVRRHNDNGAAVTIQFIRNSS